MFYMFESNTGSNDPDNSVRPLSVRPPYAGSATSPNTASDADVQDFLESTGLSEAPSEVLSTRRRVAMYVGGVIAPLTALGSGLLFATAAAWQTAKASVDVIGSKFQNADPDPAFLCASGAVGLGLVSAVNAVLFGQGAVPTYLAEKARRNRAIEASFQDNFQLPSEKLSIFDVPAIPTNIIPHGSVGRKVLEFAAYSSLVPIAYKALPNLFSYMYNTARQEASTATSFYTDAARFETAASQSAHNLGWWLALACVAVGAGLITRVMPDYEQATSTLLESRVPGAVNHELKRRRRSQ